MLIHAIICHLVMIYWHVCHPPSVSEFFSTFLWRPAFESDFLIEAEHDAQLSQQFMRNHRNLYATALKGKELKVHFIAPLTNHFDKVLRMFCCRHPTRDNRRVYRHLQNGLRNVQLSKTGHSDWCWREFTGGLISCKLWKENIVSINRVYCHQYKRPIIFNVKCSLYCYIK